MRFNISPDQLKKLASRVGVHMPAIPHTRLLNVLSRGFGWRDWHDLSSQRAEYREGKKFPIPSLDGRDLSSWFKETGYLEYRQQMHSSFWDAFSDTLPTVDHRVMLVSLLNDLGCIDGDVKVVKPVRKGLPSAQVASGFYRLSLTNQLGLNPDPQYKGEILNCNSRFDVRQCDGCEIDPEEHMGAYDPHKTLSRAQHGRWFDTVIRHSNDEPEYAPGSSREPFCLVCRDFETGLQHGMVMASWEVVCPADVPHYDGTLRILAAVGDCKKARLMLGTSINDVICGSIEAALWGLVDCPEAKLTISVLLVKPYAQMREIGEVAFNLLSNSSTLAPCLKAARARLELRETDVLDSEADVP